MSTHRSEEQLAEARNDYQQRVYLRRRRRSVACFIASLLAAAVTFAQSLDFASVATVVALLISALFYFDANGHLHELRRRTRKTLAPKLSVLDGEASHTGPAPQAPTQTGSHL